MKLQRESNLMEVFEYIEKVPTCVILFVDQSALCTQFTTQGWIQQEGIEVVDVDAEMVDVLQIGKVPQFRFYVEGTEVHDLIGTSTHEHFKTRKSQLFAPTKMKLSNIKKPASLPEAEL